MDRDEILKLAQKENENYDEREVFIQMKGYSYGMIASSIMFTFLVILKVFRGESIYDILAMYEAAMITFYVYKYKMEKKKIDLFCSICWGIATVLNLYLIIWRQ
nr:DUF6442 family protein [uncultured Faecalimonas sp.]